MQLRDTGCPRPQRLVRHLRPRHGSVRLLHEPPEHFGHACRPPAGLRLARETFGPTRAAGDVDDLQGAGVRAGRRQDASRHSRVRISQDHLAVCNR